MQGEARRRRMTDLRETVTLWTHGRSRQSAPPLEAVRLTLSTTSNGDSGLHAEHSDDAAYEQQLLGHGWSAYGP